MALVDIIKLRWRIERDYEELKGELGLAHFEGRGWRGFHHHASLCIAAYGFLILEEDRLFPPQPAGAAKNLPFPAVPIGTRRRSVPSATAQLGRDGAKATENRPGEVPVPMPMLPSRLTQRRSFTAESPKNL